MNTYIIFGKANSEYASGMINKPQDRLSIVKKVTDQFDMNFREFLGLKRQWLLHFVNDELCASLPAFASRK